MERSASARSSATTAAASARGTCGPSPASREPSATARSQSIIDGPVEGGPVVAGVLMPCNLAGPPTAEMTLPTGRDDARTTSR